MAVTRLFENVVLDFERLTGPSLNREPETRERKEGRKITLATFRSEHLETVACLLELYEDAVSRKFVPDSEGCLIAFLTTATRCLRQGKNPAGLFRFLVVRGLIYAATLEDEDLAYAALKNYRRAMYGRLPFLKMVGKSESE